MMVMMLMMMVMVMMMMIMMVVVMVMVIMRVVLVMVVVMIDNGDDDDDDDDDDDCYQSTDPPQQAPVITGYTKDEVLQEGHILTMTCSVGGGKPLVTSVIFSCSGHSDTEPDVTIQDHVHSFLTISPLRVEDDGERCVCTAEWKDTDWYRLSATIILRVNGETTLTPSPPPPGFCLYFDLLRC